METMALITIVCMSTIAGIAGIAVLVEMFNDHRRESTQCAFFGFLFVVFGLFFIRHSETKRTVSTGKVRKYKLLKNSVYTVEELKD